MPLKGISATKNSIKKSCYGFLLSEEEKIRLVKTGYCLDKWADKQQATPVHTVTISWFGHPLGVCLVATKMTVFLV